MNDGGQGPKKIKVVDRRPFDESGELRPDRPAPPPKPPVEPASPRAERTAAAGPEPGPRPQAAAGARPSTAGAATSPLFLDLVAWLAQQAEILVTGGQGLPAQPAEAQRVIEYLAMLESKTKGNLSAEEAQILSNVIFQLRALYVQHQR